MLKRGRLMQLRSMVQMKILEHYGDLPIPQYATLGSAGLDLLAAVPQPVSITPGERILVPTGISIALDRAFEAQIRSRSGLALNHGIVVLNSPGTIDSDYRGEVKVILINHSKLEFHITRGMKIAQMIISKHERIEWDIVKDFDNTTARGNQGFGSTGI